MKCKKPQDCACANITPRRLRISARVYRSREECCNDKDETLNDGVGVGGDTLEGWQERDKTREGKELGLRVTFILFFMLFCIFCIFLYKVKAFRQHKYNESNTNTSEHKVAILLLVPYSSVLSRFIL